jgi:ABC-type phosphate transport system substrate-binding protein
MYGLSVLISPFNIMKKLLIIVFLIFFSNHLRADIAVIGHINSGLTSMTKKQVKDVFMGRTQYLPSGNFALPIDELSLRAHFYYALTHRPIEQVNAYWARIMFSGQASPPMKLPNAEAIIKVVSENKGAIGYIDQKEVDKNIVNVLLLLKQTDKM